LPGSSMNAASSLLNHASRRTDSFQRTAFRYDHRNDLYACPSGKHCRNYASPRPGVDKDSFMRYRASQHDCQSCALKPKCCPGHPARKVMRSVHEGARDLARDRSQTDAYVTFRRERKKVENAVRPSQAYPEARSLAPTRTKWRKR